MGETTKIRKGPWKAEEDEVLRNHVKKYGPRDWSSIRSKGLLQRTGKSCRLRWVNKLRPNLKSGCKFSAEEERIVIELQSQFGNRWAKIATYLPGRTDNDVKNFWSSRQKRLARLLHLQSQQHKSSHHPNNRRFRKEAVSISLPSIPPTNNHHHQKAVQQSFPPSLSSFSNPNPHHSSTLLSSSSYVNNITTTAATDPDINGMLSFDYEASNYGSYLFNNPQFPIGSSSNNPYDELHPQPQPPFSVLPQPPQLFPILSGTQELIDRLDLTFMPEFGSTHHVSSLAPTPDALHVPDNYELPSTPLRLPKVEVSDLKSSGGPQGGGGCDGNETLDPPPLTPDSFFDDFPSDVFDQIESLPSPSHW